MIYKDNIILKLKKNIIYSLKQTLKDLPWIIIAGILGFILDFYIL